LKLHNGSPPPIPINSGKKAKLLNISNWVDFVLFFFFFNEIGGLPTHLKPRTIMNTKSGTSNFNFFWVNVDLDSSLHRMFFDLKSQFSTNDEGILCLASMTHKERGLTLAHYVNKSTTVKKGQAFLKGCAKKNYLDAIQRFLKQFELFYGLDNLYDTAKWSWSQHQD
jgi:hypothetical protein